MANHGVSQLEFSDNVQAFPTKLLVLTRLRVGKEKQHHKEGDLVAISLIC